MKRTYPSLPEVELAARDGALAGLIDTLRAQAEDRDDAASHWLARALRVDFAALVSAPN